MADRNPASFSVAVRQERSTITRQSVPERERGSLCATGSVYTGHCSRVYPISQNIHS